MKRLNPFMKRNLPYYKNIVKDALEGLGQIRDKLQTVLDLSDESQDIRRFLREDMCNRRFAFADKINKHRKTSIETPASKLSRTLECRPLRVCKDLTLCPICLFNYKYALSKKILKVRLTTNEYCLVRRRESYILPRGVYTPYDYDGMERLHPLYASMRSDFRSPNIYINPVYELPGSHGPYYSTRDDYDGSVANIARFRANPDQKDDNGDYSQMFEWTWKHLSGTDYLNSEYEYQSVLKVMDRDPEYKERIEERIEERNEFRKMLVRCTDPEMSKDNLSLRLSLRRKQLNAMTKDAVGAVHRIAIAPLPKNDTVIMIRLDSLFVMRKDLYQTLCEKYPEVWCYQKYNRRYPFYYNGVAGVWDARVRTQCACRPIPKSIEGVYSVVNKSFPYLGTSLAKCYSIEMALILSVLRDYRSFTTVGCMRDCDEWAA